MTFSKLIVLPLQKNIKWEKVQKERGWKHKMGVGNVFEDNVTKNYQKFSFIKKCKQYQYFNKS